MHKSSQEIAPPSSDVLMNTLQIKLGNVEEKLVEISDQEKEHFSKIEEKLEKIGESFNTKLNDPKDGIYTRLLVIEQWKKNMSKIVWLLVGTSLGLVGTVIKKFIVG